MLSLRIPDDMIQLQREIDAYDESIRKMQSQRKDMERKLYERAAYFADTIQVEFIGDHSGIKHPPIPGVSVEIMMLAVSSLARLGKKKI